MASSTEKTIMYKERRGSVQSERPCSRCTDGVNYTRCFRPDVPEVRAATRASGLPRRFTPVMAGRAISKSAV